jgi:hypothetical protein
MPAARDIELTLEEVELILALVQDYAVFGRTVDSELAKDLATRLEYEVELFDL